MLVFSISLKSFACCWVCYSATSCFGSNGNCSDFSWCTGNSSCTCAPCAVNTNYTFSATGLAVKFEGSNVYTTGGTFIGNVSAYVTNSQVFTISYNSSTKKYTLKWYTASLVPSGLEGAYVGQHTF